MSMSGRRQQQQPKNEPQRNSSLTNAATHTSTAEDPHQSHRASSICGEKVPLSIPRQTRWSLPRSSPSVRLSVDSMAPIDPYQELKLMELSTECREALKKIQAFDKYFYLRNVDKHAREPILEEVARLEKIKNQHKVMAPKEYDTELLITALYNHIRILSEISRGEKVIQEEQVVMKNHQSQVKTVMIRTNSQTQTESEIKAPSHLKYQDLSANLEEGSMTPHFGKKNSKQSPTQIPVELEAEHQIAHLTAKYNQHQQHCSMYHQTPLRYFCQAIKYLGQYKCVHSGAGYVEQGPIGNIPVLLEHSADHSPQNQPQPINSSEDQIINQFRQMETRLKQQMKVVHQKGIINPFQFCLPPPSKQIGELCLNNVGEVQQQSKLDEGEIYRSIGVLSFLGINYIRLVSICNKLQQPLFERDYLTLESLNKIDRPVTVDFCLHQIIEQLEEQRRVKQKKKRQHKQKGRKINFNKTIAEHNRQKRLMEKDVLLQDEKGLLDVEAVGQVTDPFMDSYEGNLNAFVSYDNLSNKNLRETKPVSNSLNDRRTKKIRRESRRRRSDFDKMLPMDVAWEIRIQEDQVNSRQRQQLQEQQLQEQQLQGQQPEGYNLPLINIEDTFNRLEASNPFSNLQSPDQYRQFHSSHYDFEGSEYARSIKVSTSLLNAYIESQRRMLEQIVDLTEQLEASQKRIIELQTIFKQPNCVTEIIRDQNCDINSFHQENVLEELPQDVLSGYLASKQYYSRPQSYCHLNANALFIETTEQESQTIQTSLGDINQQQTIQISPQNIEQKYASSRNDSLVAIKQTFEPSNEVSPEYNNQSKHIEIEIEKEPQITSTKNSILISVEEYNSLYLRIQLYRLEIQTLTKQIDEELSYAPISKSNGPLSEQTISEGEYNKILSYKDALERDKQSLQLQYQQQLKRLEENELHYSLQCKKRDITIFELHCRIQLLIKEQEFSDRRFKKIDEQQRKAGNRTENEKQSLQTMKMEAQLIWQSKLDKAEARTLRADQERLLFQQKMIQIRQQMTNLESQLRKCQAQLEEANYRFSILDTERSYLITKNQKTESKLWETETHMNLTQNELQKHKDSIIALETTLRRVNEQVVVQKENVKIEELLEQLKQKQGEFQILSQCLSASNLSLQEEIFKSEAALKNSNLIKEEMTKLQDQCMQLQQKVHSMEVTLANMEHNLSIFDQQNSRSNSHINWLQQQGSQNMQMIAKYEQQIGLREQKIVETNSKLQSLQNRSKLNEATISGMEDGFKLIKMQNIKLKEQLKSAQVQSQLQKSQQVKLTQSVDSLEQKLREVSLLHSSQETECFKHMSYIADLQLSLQESQSRVAELQPAIQTLNIKGSEMEDNRNQLLIYARQLEDRLMEANSLQLKLEQTYNQLCHCQNLVLQNQQEKSLLKNQVVLLLDKVSHFERMQTRHNQLQSSERQLNRMVADLTNKVQNYEQTHSQLYKNYSELMVNQQVERAKFKEEKEELKQAIKSLTQQCQQLLPNSASQSFSPTANSNYQQNPPFTSLNNYQSKGVQKQIILLHERQNSERSPINSTAALRSEKSQTQYEDHTGYALRLDIESLRTARSIKTQKNSSRIMQEPRIIDRNSLGQTNQEKLETLEKEFKNSYNSLLAQYSFLYDEYFILLNQMNQLKTAQKPKPRDLDSDAAMSYEELVDGRQNILSQSEPKSMDSPLDKILEVPQPLESATEMSATLIGKPRQRKVVQRWYSINYSSKDELSQDPGQTDSWTDRQNTLLAAVWAEVKRVKTDLLTAQLLSEETHQDLFERSYEFCPNCDSCSQHSSVGVSYQIQANDEKISLQLKILMHSLHAKLTALFSELNLPALIGSQKVSSLLFDSLTNFQSHIMPSLGL